MVVSKKANEIADRLYKAHGTGTGILFGIPSSFRGPVKWIIQFTLNDIEKE